MCGIFGYFSRNNNEMPNPVIEAMGDLLIHRGPDDVGIYKDKGVALGNRRLSIIDIEGGHQPFVSDNGDVVVVQNGEVFNHKELAQNLSQSGYPCKTHCDTEVILRLYERDGKTKAASEIYQKIMGFDVQEAKIAKTRLEELNAK